MRQPPTRITFIVDGRGPPRIRHLTVGLASSRQCCSAEEAEPLQLRGHPLGRRRARPGQAIGTGASLEAGLKCFAVRKPSAPEPWLRGKPLVGRDQELRSLDDLLEALRLGESRALVIHGEPGLGKTALMDALAERATDCRVIRIAGFEAEMEVPFAGLHQLCAPLLDRLELLPAPQRLALEVTFGIRTAPAPERLLVGLAVLSLLAEVAVERPLLCLVDDAQWLDQPSAQITAFVARRLGAEAVGMVTCTRRPSSELVGLQELALEGLDEKDARALLSSVLPMLVDERVCQQFVAETGGNPLALLELPRSLTAAELALGFSPPVDATLSTSIENSFCQRVRQLPAETQRLLLIAAADPLGDPLLIWGAAERLSIDAVAARPAVEEKLISFGARVHFRHPLVRSAIYRSASADDQKAVHGALAEATDPALDPERRVWHRARAASGPDEEIAAELERHAGEAQARGGLAAAAAMLEQAAALSPDPERRAVRSLAAGQAKIQAGALNSAAELLAVAEAGPLGELDRARVDLVRAQLAFATDRGNSAPPLLLQAAQRFEAVDVDLARATYLDALMAASLAGDLAAPNADVPAVARAAACAPRPRRASMPSDLLLDGLAATFTNGYGAGLPLVRAAVAADTDGMPADRELRWLAVAYRAAMHSWDDAGALAHCSRFVQLAREMGAVTELALGINDLALLLMLCGESAASAVAVEEAYAIAEALNDNFVPYGAMGVAALRGNEEEASALIDAHRTSAAKRGEGAGIAGSRWAEAVLNNGLGRYEKALTASQLAVDATNRRAFELFNWVLGELVEAAERAGLREVAAEMHVQLAETAEITGTGWVFGLLARAHAMTSEAESAEKFYRESIDCYEATRLRTEVARAHLLFGEWLRRQRRRDDARAELHLALDMMEEMGLNAFAERARRELGASGERARQRSVETGGELTAQESQVAHLALEGLSNPEIAGRLFISARTVQYHLSKVFAKLGITSRSQLDGVLN